MRKLSKKEYTEEYKRRLKYLMSLVKILDNVIDFLANRNEDEFTPDHSRAVGKVINRVRVLYNDNNPLKHALDGIHKSMAGRMTDDKLKAIINGKKVLENYIKSI